jgi:hypothetical protein
MASNNITIIRLSDDARIEIASLLLECQLGANAAALATETLTKRAPAPNEIAALHRLTVQVAEALAVLDALLRDLFDAAGDGNAH